MSDQLFDSRRFRLLTLVDNFTRESLAIRVGQRLTGDDVVATLEAIQKNKEQFLNPFESTTDLSLSPSRSIGERTSTK